MPCGTIAEVFMGTFDLALRNVSRQRARTAVTLAAIATGVASIILAGGWINDIYVQLAEALIHSQSGHLQIARTGYYATGTRQPERYLLDDHKTLAARVSNTAGVQFVAARLNFSGLLNNGNADLPIIGQGVEPDKEAELGSYMHLSAGHRLTSREPAGMMIGSGVAQSLNLVPGSQVTVVATTIDGGMNTLDFDVVGVFDSFSKDYDARAVQIPLAAAQALVGTKGVNSMVVVLQRTGDTDRIAAQLRSALTSSGLEVLSWLEMNDFYTNTVALYDAQFAFLQAIILFMIILSVANSLNMSIYERVGEFGTMMALGNRRTHVRRLILVESAVLGIIGAAAGCVGGMLAAWGVSIIGISMPPPPNSEMGYVAHVRIVPAQVGVALLIGVCASVAAAVVPAQRISRMSPVEALRHWI
jgi:putative ABC transport system permease protein